MKKITHPHDKIIRTILDNKEEVTLLINKMLNLEKHKKCLHTKDIEKYNRKFITTTLENSEADIVYKLKNKNIFFLIEHQSKIDYAMSYRIKEYSSEIIESAIDKEKLNSKKYKYPNVYSMVVYTGDKKWNASTSFQAQQLYLYETKKSNCNEYNVLDISQISENELLENNGFLGKILLIEKSKTQDEIIESIEKVLNTNLKVSDKKLLKRFIYYILNKKIPEEKMEKFLKILDRKKENNMRWVETLLNGFDEKFEEGIKQGINQGIDQGILRVAINMIKKNMKIEDVQECTGLSKKEIQDLKLEYSKS